MNAGLKVFAPASVANVAVGYDILGFAINGPGDEVTVKPGKKPGLHITKISGTTKKLPRDPLKNTAGVAALSVLESLGKSDEAIEMEIYKKMPFGSGLGSSAASAAAGAMAINEYYDNPYTKAELLYHAVKGEQVADGAWHADNVAPSLLGGMVLIRDNETLDFTKLPVPKGLYAVVIYPHISILTKDSRAVLSENISLSQHIVQSGNLASFVAAMYTSNIEMMKRSLKDLIIEPQRQHLIPCFGDMKKIALDHQAMGFSISGAGPSVFALCQSTLIAENIASDIKNLLRQNSIESNTYISQINLEGAIKF